MTTAAEILNKAAAHLQDRASTYDKPSGERSMGATVAAFSAITGVTLTAEQGWLFMTVLKAVRSQQGAYRADNYEDGAAYFALACETAEVERMSKDDVRAKLQEIAKPARAEELQADDGWVEWGGGECPIPSATPIDARLSDGDVVTGYTATAFHWQHKGVRHITHYRIAKEQA